MSDNAYMSQYIDNGHSQVISLNNLYNTILIGDKSDPDHIFRVPISDFFLTYKDQLKDYTRIYVLPESMFYKPKSVSLELYGTTELWLSLLRVNGMRNSTEFCVPNIKIYDADMLRELINIFFKREKKMI